jgi:hypothetical protein
VPTNIAFRTPNTTGRPWERVANPASSAKIATASRIEVSFLRVEMEIRANVNATVKSPLLVE